MEQSEALTMKWFSEADGEKGRSWLRKAAEQGQEDAIKWLKKLDERAALQD